MVAPQLYEVSIAEIAVKGEFLRPTSWDHKAVYTDLLDYIRKTQAVNATPEIKLVENELVLVSGQPFVLAAREAGIDKLVVCMNYSVVEPRRHALKHITAAELNAAIDARRNEPVLNILYFDRMLDDKSLAFACRRIEDCLSQRLSFGFDTVGERTALAWHAHMLSGEDARIRHLTQAIAREIHPQNAVSSLNGMRLIV